MATLGTPQTQAGILSFYDAPEKGPRVSAKLVLILVAFFAIVVLIFDHFLMH
ncbi:MAG: preprotein translocase subunit Sec61beta [Candidatus Micrarchaeia archaeon]|jgi:preprotein translocase subunit Sec61beta